MQVKLLACAVVAASSILVISPGRAADSTTDFQVRVVIASSCNVGAVTATDVDFGTLQATATNATATGQLNVYCTVGTPYTIALNAGSNASGGIRRMRNGTSYIEYGLYRTAGTTQPWSDQPGEIHSGSGSGAVQQIPVYGVVPNAFGPAGSYVDTVTATLTY